MDDGAEPTEDEIRAALVDLLAGMGGRAREARLAAEEEEATEPRIVY